jgi:endonuclease/exonuclease/phosphatase family metal-dependent hydrolase
VSAYHYVHQADFGHEVQPTHHYLRRASRPYHIDFCFVPRAWAESGITATIESDADWPALSDHFPVVVETLA